MIASKPVSGLSTERFSSIDTLPSSKPLMAFSSMTNNEVSVSRHPVLPHSQSLLLVKSGIWLNSPANPLSPLNNRPFNIIPNPTPQPRLMTSVLSWYLWAPKRCSANAIRLESLSMNTWQPVTSAIVSVTLFSCPFKKVWLIPFGHQQNQAWQCQYPQS